MKEMHCGQNSMVVFFHTCFSGLLLDDCACKNYQAGDSGLIRNCVRQWAFHLLLIRHLTG
jgi:hypothetical protein